MNTYKITMTVDKNQLIRFIDLVGLDQNVSVEALPDPTEPPSPLAASDPVNDAPKRRGAPRGPRGSKVNEAIQEALALRPHTNKELRAVLESSKLAAGSLSTGLAILQRQGKIERVGDGLYALKVAAE